MMNVFAIPIYQDNYVWVIRHQQQCWLVDPGAYEPVNQALTEHKLQLIGVLVTHKHWDHISGIAPLLETHKIPVIGPAHLAAQQVTQHVQNLDKLTLFADKVEVLSVPGHTNEHLAYFFPKQAWLFSGDTLFSAGCGRLLGGSAEDLFASLQKLKQLPSQTLVFASHEYTLANLRFAAHVEPSNTNIAAHIEQCQALRQASKPTLPTTLSKELAINPFLRTHSSQIKQSVEAHFHCSCYSEFDVFKLLRQWKDTF